MASPPVHSRDRALRRLSLVTKGVAAGAVIATGGVTAAIASATPAQQPAPAADQKKVVKKPVAPRATKPATRASRPPVMTTTAKKAPATTAGMPSEDPVATTPSDDPAPTTRSATPKKTSTPKPPPAPPTTTEPPPPTNTYTPPVVPDPTPTGGS